MKAGETGMKAWLREISIPVYILIGMFAISSWIDINGVWVELPLLVNELPEGWSLPSYIVVTIQVANIGPLIYTVAHKCYPEKVKEWPVVYIITLTGAVACVFLAYYWRSTSYIFGEKHSTVLIGLVTILSLVDCTSSVVYLPYMKYYKLQYMSALYVGEGSSGLLPAIFGLIQGVGGDPVCVNGTVVKNNGSTNYTVHQIYPMYDPPIFSVKTFFFILFGVMCLSGIAFTCLHFVPVFKKHQINSGTYKVETTEEKRDGEMEELPKLENVVKVTESHSPRLSTYNYVIVLIVTGWVNGLTNAVLLSTQSYSALPYGNAAYSLMVRLSVMANPVMCFIALFLPSKSITLMNVLCTLGSVLSGYLLFLAAMSPNPPLAGQLSGSILVVFSGVATVMLFSYAKVLIASILRDSGRPSALLWCGVSTQVGSMIGAIVTFVCVNILQLFKSAPTCPGSMTH